MGVKQVSKMVTIYIDMMLICVCFLTPLSGGSFLVYCIIINVFFRGPFSDPYFGAYRSDHGSNSTPIGVITNTGVVTYQYMYDCLCWRYYLYGSSPNISFRTSFIIDI